VELDLFISIDLEVRSIFELPLSSELAPLIHDIILEKTLLTEDLRLLKDSWKKARLKRISVNVEKLYQHYEFRNQPIKHKTISRK
jgi:hypothetical protein